MDNILFKGIYSATFSIYDENLNVKKDSVDKLVRYNLRNGVAGFYVGGNTGECTVLPNRTRKQMLETVKESAGGQGKIIAHVGAGHMDDVMDLIGHANALGVDAIASLPPSLTSYYKADEIIEYYRQIAAIAKAPVLAYVTPVLSCDVMWFANQIMDIENIVGIKLTVADYYLFEKIKLVKDGNINILNGPDESMLSGLVMGADGAIGTTYNLMPATACRIYSNFKKNDVTEALNQQHKLNRCIDILLGSNIAKWKAVLTVLDSDPGYTVDPARMPSESEVREVIALLEKADCTKEMV